MADGFLDAIAGISGKTSFEVWESGNDWSEIIKNAESVLGKQSKWNVLTDEAGNAFQIIGKNGKFINVESTAGAAENFIAGNQLVTDVVKEESGALTAYTGNIVTEAGEIRKKGLALGATTGAKVVGGALAAFGAIATGVNWYKDNPEFWTEVSQKLLPFAYADPTDKSWGDIFYDALTPSSVDSDGNTYVPADLLEALSTVLVNQGIYNYNYSADTSNIESSELAKLDSRVTSLGSIKFYKINKIEYFKDGSSKQGYTFSETLNVARIDEGSSRGYLAVASKNLFTASYILGSGGGSLSVNQNVLLKTEKKPYTTSCNYNRPENGWTAIPELQTSYYRSNISGISEFLASIEYLLAFGNIISEAANLPDNTQLIPDATYPSAGTSLRDTYPEWYDRAVTTVNPNWNPSEPESDENPKYVTWLPLQFPDVDVPDGYTQPDTTPEDAQSGKPKPDSPVNPDTNKALDDGVLPNPYPNPDEQSSINPVPQPEPQPAPQPEPTDPSDPGSIPSPTPTPGIPVIGGGSANALWKIYNPSQAILQQFGKWLWSTDPVKMIKELFSNNPADGIVGLHMIYATPAVGGTANIVVGYVDSGVASPWVSQQYVSIDCGSVTIPLRYQSALDFGYTKVYAYLPFIGIVPLDSFDIMGKTVGIKYTVDVMTGTVLAQISVKSGDYSAVLYTFNGSCSVEYPLTSGSRASQLLSLVTGAVGGAVVGGVGGALLGGARGALTGADVRMSGNLAGNAGAMGIRKPYIIVKRPIEVAARNYNNFYGYPANTTGKLSTFSGYTRVKDVHVENISGATAEEKQEIENLLKSGVIVQ